MELRQLEYFAAVVRHRHFGRAAEEVYVTPSALSQQVRRLEEELGLTLLLRTPQGVAPTPAGAEFLDHAQGILQGVAEARTAIDEHLRAVRGVARVAATTCDSRGLPAALVAFHRAHPGVQLSLRHGSAAEVIELMAAGAADVALLGLAHGRPRIPDGIEVTVVRREPLRLIGGPDSPFAGRTDAGFDELRGRPVILAERGTALRELVVAGCEAAGFSPLPLFQTTDPATIRSLASAGVAVSAVPASWLEGEAAPPAIAQFAAPAPVYAVALLSTTGGHLPVRQLVVEHLVRFFGGAGGQRDAG